MCKHISFRTCLMWAVTITVVAMLVMSMRVTLEAPTLSARPEWLVNTVQIHGVAESEVGKHWKAPVANDDDEEATLADALLRRLPTRFASALGRTPEGEGYAPTQLKSTPHEDPQAVLCSIVRNEAAYLPEWLEFHMGKAGFAVAYLLDDGSTDGTAELLQHYTRNHMVRQFYIHDLIMEDALFTPATKLRTGTLLQTALLNTCARLVQADASRRSNTSGVYGGPPPPVWVFGLDVDEFMYPTADAPGLTVSHVLSTMQDAGVTLVSIPRMLFGSGGAVKATPGLVVERFTKRMDPVSLARRCTGITGTPAPKPPATGFTRSTYDKHWRLWHVCTQYDHVADAAVMRGPSLHAHVSASRPQVCRACKVGFVVGSATFTSPHAAMLKSHSGGSLHLPLDHVFRINHYQTKSKAEYLERSTVARLWASRWGGTNKAEHWFQALDLNEMEDVSAVRYAPGVNDVTLPKKLSHVVTRKMAHDESSHVVSSVEGEEAALDVPTSYARAFVSWLHDDTTVHELNAFHGDDSILQRSIVPFPLPKPADDAASSPTLRGSKKPALTPPGDPRPPPPTPPASEMLVLGIQHTGTSIITRLLMLMGAWAGMPQELDILPSNPLLYYERREMVDINRRLLEGEGAVVPRFKGALPWLGAGFSMQRAPLPLVERHSNEVADMVHRMAPFRPWVAKDPRTCLTSQAWVAHMSAPVCVLVWRDPLETALLLATHGDNLNAKLILKPQAMLDVFMAHLMTSINACKGHPTIVVPFEQLYQPQDDAKTSMYATHWGSSGYGPMAVMQRMYSLLSAVGTPRLSLPSQDALRGALGGANSLQRQERKNHISFMPPRHTRQSARLVAAVEKQLREQTTFAAKVGMPQTPEELERAAGAAASSPGHPLRTSKALVNDVQGGAAIHVHCLWLGPAADFQGRPLSMFESVFYHHPTATITIHSNTLSKGRDSVRAFLNRGYKVIIAALPDAAEVRKYLDLWPYRGQQFYDTHTAQLYRYMILYEHGGFFMDTEMLVMNPLDDIPQNSLSYEFDGLHPPTPGSSTIKAFRATDASSWVLTGALMRFEKKHWFLRKLLEEAKKDYSPSDWINLGARLLTTVHNSLSPERKAQVQVLPTESVTPVAWSDMVMCFEAPNRACNDDICDNIARWSYTVRLFHRLTHLKVPTEDSCAKHLLSMFKVLNDGTAG